MTKGQLVAKLAEAGGVGRKQADDFLNALIDTVVKSVKKTLLSGAARSGGW